MKAQHEAARSALVGDVGKVEAGILQADVKVSLGQPLKLKPEVAVRSKIKLIDGKDIPNVKLSGTHLTSGKSWSRREGLQSQQEHRPRVVGKPVLDEIASNKTQNVSLLEFFLLNNEIKLWMCKKLPLLVAHSQI